jgi:hypothetical protein
MLSIIALCRSFRRLMHKSVSGPKQGCMLARPGTSDADFEAINACFQAPLEGASAFEFMSLRIPGLSGSVFRGRCSS